ncbi:MAG: hypothetical protein MEP44_00330, partial [Blastomonas sp.]|nr:hypothetical protein [Blastomonas sp.]
DLAASKILERCPEHDGGGLGHAATLSNFGSPFNLADMTIKNRPEARSFQPVFTRHGLARDTSSKLR